MITMATGVVVLTPFQTRLKSFDFPLSNIPYHNLKQQKNQIELDRKMLNC